VADWLTLDRRREGVVGRMWARMRADVPASSIVEPVIAIAGFLIGAFPVLYYNAVSRGSYLVLRANLFSTEKGVDNFALWENLKTEADAMQVLLNGGYFWYYGGIATNPLYPWLAGIATVGLLLLVHRVPEYLRYRRVTVFLLGFVLVTFFLSCFSVSILGATHLLIMLPIPQLVIAAFAVLGARWLVARVEPRVISQQALVAIIVAALLVPLLAFDLRVDAHYHRTLARTGGHSAFSSAIYTLADVLDHGDITHPYALDWGMKYPVMILTDGRVEPLEIFGATYEAGPDFTAAVNTALREPDPVFISTTAESAAYPRLDAFRQIVAASGRELVLDRTINELDGRPLYYVFRVR
jgi:hypothetical protein